MALVSHQRHTVQVVKGIGALAILVALLIGVPLTLAVTVGWPLPHHVPPLAGLRTSGATLGVPEQTLIDVLAWAAWLAWLNIVLSVLGDLVAQIRGRPFRTIPILGAFRPLTSPLLGAVFVAFFAFGQSQTGALPSTLAPNFVQVGSMSAVLAADQSATPTAAEAGEARSAQPRRSHRSSTRSGPGTPCGR